MAAVGSGPGRGVPRLPAADQPDYIDPLFNTYRPLADEGEAADPGMARANGSRRQRLPVRRLPADQPDQRQRKRLPGHRAHTLNDNLLKRHRREIKAVMGHEIGHYVLNHAYKMLLAFGVILVFGLAFLSGLGGRLRAGARAGRSAGSRPGRAAAAVLLVSIFMFVHDAGVQHRDPDQRVEADMYGLNAIRQPDGFAGIHLKLGEYRKSSRARSRKCSSSTIPAAATASTPPCAGRKKT